MDYDKLFSLIKDLKKQFEMFDTEELKDFTEHLSELSDEEFNDNISVLSEELSKIVAKLSADNADFKGLNMEEVLNALSGQNSNIDIDSIKGLLSGMNPKYLKVMERLQVLSENIKKK